MMKLIDAAKEHYKALGIQKITVPEWQVDGKPVVIYWNPLTIEERAKSLRPGSAPADIVKSYADIVIMKAMDAGGEKLFTSLDKLPLLNQVDASVIQRIASAMLDVPTAADAEKN